MNKKVIFLVAASLAVAIMGIYAFFVQYEESWVSGEPSVEDYQIVAPSTEEIELLKKNDALLRSFGYLNSLDEKYYSWPEDSASSSREIFNSFRLSTERNIKNLVDSLDEAKTKYPDAFIPLLQNMILYYKKILNDRSPRALADQKRVVSEPVVQVTDVNVDRLQYELLKKDEQLIDLTNKLSEWESKSSYEVNIPATSTADESGEKEKQINELQEKYSTLEKQHRSLSARMNESENKSSQQAANSERIAELEAAIRLAVVDCNLVRADGREIISNSKQRKALLEESLTILRNLSLSQNKIVQKQAKEKMQELKTVASMIRD